MKFLLLILLVVSSAVCEYVQQDLLTDEEAAQGKMFQGGSQEKIFAGHNDKHLQFNDLRDNKHESYRSSSSSSGGGSVLAFIIGPFLFILAFPILWFNERRYVIDQYRITHAFQSCNVVDCNVFSKENEKQLVFTNGRAVTNDVITDQQFAIAESNSIKVERRVDMFQWVETSHTDNDNYTHYTYSQDWRDHFIDSSNFNQPGGHENDQSKWVVTKQTFLAPNVQLGQYIVSDSLKQQTCKFQPIQLNQTNCQLAQQQFRNVHPFITLEGQSILFKQFQGNSFSGDLKVHFVKVPCEDISIVSEQVDNTFQPWIIHDKYDESQHLDQLEDQGCCSQMCSCIKEMEAPLLQIDWIFESLLTKAQAFSTKLKESSLKTTLIRIGGWLLMVFGLCIFFSPISTIISYFPLLGNFLAAVTSFIFGIICLILGSITAMITIAIAWLRFRPLAALGLIILSGALSVGIYMWAKSHQ